MSAPVRLAEVLNRFKHHPPTGDAVQMHEKVRATFAALAGEVWADLPESREKSLALTALQEAAMWANAAIAIHISGAEGQYEQQVPQDDARASAGSLTRMTTTSTGGLGVTVARVPTSYVSQHQIKCANCGTLLDKRPFPQHANPHWDTTANTYTCDAGDRARVGAAT